MTKQHFFFKLIPPRPTFAQDMNGAEKALMQEHARAMQELFSAGKVLLYGPVLAAGGSFGVGIFEAANEDEVRQIAESDPTVRAGLHTYEISPMRIGAARALQS